MFYRYTIRQHIFMTAAKTSTNKSVPFNMASTGIVPMDEGTKKKQNPKCRLYWCLLEFKDWRYSQSCWYFRPLL
jgi:hypothetical protein